MRGNLTHFSFITIKTKCYVNKVADRTTAEFVTDLLGALIAKGYEVPATDGTFYLFPRTPGGDDEAFVQEAIRALLLLVPGGAFGLDGHFRIAYCVDDRTVDLAVERLPQAVLIEQKVNPRRDI